MIKNVFPLLFTSVLLLTVSSNAFAESLNSAFANQSILRAIEKNDVAKLDQFIRSGSIQVDQVVQGHDSMLLVAASLQKIKVIKYLIEQKANLEFQNSAGETALLVAVAANDNEAAKILIEAGVKVDAKSTQTGDSVLHLAALNDNVELAKFFLQKYPDLAKLKNQNDETALHKAAYFGALRVIPQLLKSGADPFQKNKSGLTAAEVARVNNLSAAQKLIEKK